MCQNHTSKLYKLMQHNKRHITKFYFNMCRKDQISVENDPNAIILQQQKIMFSSQYSKISKKNKYKTTHKIMSENHIPKM